MQARSKPSSPGSHWINQKTAPYFFLFPTALVFLAFMFYPITDSLWLSLFDFNNGIYTFVGLKNYLTLLKDPVFFKSLSNTVIYLAIQVPLMVSLSLVLAVLLDRKGLKFKGFFRTGLFLPTITALVAYALVFKLLLNTDHGLINYLLESVHLPPVNWLKSAWPARFSIVMAITWRWTGYNMVIMIAGLQAIPDVLYEAADVDGASPLQQFFQITIPAMKPIILFTSITSTIGTLQLFDESFVLTLGGPNNATLTTGHYLYNTGFRFFKFGYAAAISYVLVIIIAALSYIQFKVSEE